MLSSGPDEAAKKGWEVLKRLDATKQADDDELAKALGFASAQQASQSQLGRALQVFRVGLAELQKYKAVDDPNALLFDTRSFIYPLLVNKIALSSLTVTEFQDGSKWGITKQGSSKLLSRLEQYRTPTSSFVVDIPALKLRFLGDRTGGELMLISLENVEVPRSFPNVPKLTLKEGQQRSAREIFDKLALDAQVAYEKGGEKRTAQGR